MTGVPPVGSGTDGPDSSNGATGAIGESVDTRHGSKEVPPAGGKTVFIACIYPIWPS